MKTNIFFTILCFFLSYIILSQNIISIHKESDALFEQVNKYETDYKISKEDIVFYEIDYPFLSRILNSDIPHLDIFLPFFNSNKIEIGLDLFTVYSESIDVTRYKSGKKIHQKYIPNTKTYQISSNSEDISGVFIFSENGIKAILNKGDNHYQIDLINKVLDIKDQAYYLLDTKNSPMHLDFMCAHDLLDMDSGLLHSDSQKLMSDVYGCVEIAIEIDYYTYQTFSDYQQSIDWAVEMLAVANVFYLEEIGVGIKSNSAQIWETEDPYMEFVNDPKDMLNSIRDNWSNNEGLSLINRDLVHLFSKRDNTGTGGIAFLNGLGSSWNSYGFSSNLIDIEEYIELPVPYFFWNIYCLTHELGHNFGAKHTQWCGWPGGPIDNCANLEEMSLGECSDYTNDPEPQIGTIMSYCHTWPIQDGGGITMKFDPLINNVITAYVAVQDLDDCNEEYNLGCTDPFACNYEEGANTNDDSCLYPEVGLDCFGNCLNDLNADGICDGEENLILSNGQSQKTLFMYPNPATDVITLEVDRLSVNPQEFKIFNSSGQLVFSVTNINQDIQIDISTICPGIYSAQLFTGIESKILQDHIIIQ